MPRSVILSHRISPFAGNTNSVAQYLETASPVEIILCRLSQLFPSLDHDLLAVALKRFAVIKMLVHHIIKKAAEAQIRVLAIRAWCEHKKCDAHVHET
jgi:hypothetical protein